MMIGMTKRLRRVRVKKAPEEGEVLYDGLLIERRKE